MGIIIIWGGITSLFSNFGTKVAFKNVEFTNPTAIPFYFTIDENNRLEDFCLGLQISIKLKGITTTITVSYAQQGATSAIQIPQTNDLIVDNGQIQTELNTKIKPAVDYIHDNFLTEDLSIQALASMCGMNESYFQRLFKEKYGVSPKEYLLRRRLELGVSLLIGGAPVNEDYCKKIGADVYTVDAASAADAAVEFCK